MAKIILSLRKMLAGKQIQLAISKCWMLFAVLSVWILVLYGVHTIGLNGRVEKAIDRFIAIEKEQSSGKPAQNTAIAAMQKRSPFAPPSGPPMPPQCLGILGNRALFGDKWYKAGEDAMGAKILSVDATGVKIHWEGKEQTLRPFGVAVNYAQGGPPRSMGSAPPPSPGPSQPRPSAPEGPREGGPGFGRRGFPDFRNMSPEELAKMRDRFMNMSPEERRAAYEEMRNNRSR